jgi:hypothetical protein
MKRSSRCTGVSYVEIRASQSKRYDTKVFGRHYRALTFRAWSRFEGLCARPMSPIQDYSVISCGQTLIRISRDGARTIGVLGKSGCNAKGHQPRADRNFSDLQLHVWERCGIAVLGKTRHGSHLSGTPGQLAREVACLRGDG